jgi:type IX secretion system PorP/SprF family membrane protein
MKNILRKGLVLLVLATVFVARPTSSWAQDAHFSQFYAASLYLNPALAGAERNYAANVNYRNQWRSIVVPYVTHQVSGIMPVYGKGTLKPHLGSVGVSVYNDRAGDANFNSTGANLTLSRNLLGNSTTSVLSVAGQAGIIQRSINLNNLEWGSQFNPYVGLDRSMNADISDLSNNRLMFDLNAGIFYAYNPLSNYKKTGTTFYSGLAFSHINSPNESMITGMRNNLPVLYKYHGGFATHFTEKFSLSPNVLVMNQRDIFQINAGLYATYRMLGATGSLFENTDVIFGTWYRINDAFIFNTGFGNEAFTVGFSYDVNSSSLRYNTNGRGAFEISLAVRNVKKQKVKRFDTPRI